MKKPFYLIVICGPTGVGKTTASIRIAQEFEADIISADSRQIFSELDIGTAKPNASELSQARHHLVGSISITNEFNAGDFERTALEILEEVFKENHVAVLCGGSGLYIKALLEGLDDLPDVSKEIMNDLNYEYKTSGLKALQEELKEKDPIYFEEADIQNPHRVIRALAVIRSSGFPYSKFRTGKKKKRSFTAIKIGLDLPRSELYTILNERLDGMIAKGLFDEAKRLIEFRDHGALKTVGYQEAFEFFDGSLSREEAIEKMKKNTRNYAKRQLTWFRKDSEISWFRPDQLDLILSHIKESMDI